MEPVDPFVRAARVCPSCGGREPTLGSSCPLCGRPYEARSWVDKGPLPDLDGLWGERGGFVVVPLVALLNLLLAGLWALLALPWRIASRLVGPGRRA